MAKNVSPLTRQKMWVRRFHDQQPVLPRETDAEYRCGRKCCAHSRAGNGPPLLRMAIRNQHHNFFFDLLQSDGKWHLIPVDLYHRLQHGSRAYATRTSQWRNPRLSPFNTTVLLKQWVNFWKVN
jgi:hypothetical protein